MTAPAGPPHRITASQAYTAWSETYDTTPNPLLALESRILCPLLPDLHEMSALDLACGTGRWLDHFVRNGAQACVGVDLSCDMLREAQRKPGLAHRLICADCEAIPLRSGSLDLIVCSFAASYVPDLSMFAREVSRILRTGGHLFISDFHPAAYERGWKRSFRRNDAVLEVSSFRYSIGELTAIFSASGTEVALCVEPCFGAPERSVFDTAGKAEFFDQAARDPAIFLCHFRRNTL